MKTETEAEAAAELAAINILYARAELVTLADRQALSRAIELLDNALAELAPHAPILSQDWSEAE